ncbi:papain-like cysteine protease family protein [Provencibacterium massiliense]|uniref:papain-like cysteine protease family protein n=1 Tax=Provencibacterium massiliense TaxID=1841868 RepID=UPI0009A816FF|nr:papain-like cysteine protease family protein [Provencibacterium massiliense]RGB67968.1 hypothetical protein DW086_06080 [Harryflintia acetispora]
MKKIISLLLTVIMAFTLSAAAFAEPSGTVEERASRIVSDSIQKGLIPYSREQYSLSDCIPAYYFDGAAIEEMNEAEYYLIYSGDQIVGILKANDAESGDPCYSFSEGFSAELADLTDNGKDEFFLIASVNKLFAYCDDEAVLLEEYPFIPVENVPVTLDLDDDATIGESSQSSIGDLNDQDMEVLVGSSSYQFDTSSDEKTPFAVNVAAPRSTGAMLNPWKEYKVKQPSGSNVCWAISCWEIGDWETNDESAGPAGSYKTVLDKMHKGLYDTATITEAKDAMKKVYNVNMTIKGKALTINQVGAQIEAFHPIYTNWYDSSKKKGHTVVIYGYDSEAGLPPLIYYMESLTGKGVHMEPNSQGKYVMTYTTTPFTWQDSMTVG